MQPLCQISTDQNNPGCPRQSGAEQASDGLEDVGGRLVLGEGDDVGGVHGDDVLRQEPVLVAEQLLAAVADQQGRTGKFEGPVRNNGLGPSGLV